MSETEGKYTPYRMFEAVGGWIGLSTCLGCGAAILVGETDIDAYAAHEAFHARVDPR